ncbi:MAG: hypothetical protein GC182_09900 [Rhodopseudomonas sp.]|nr:hypothetical protein [Rhodopseudomonas sp.]
MQIDHRGKGKTSRPVSRSGRMPPARAGSPQMPGLPIGRTVGQMRQTNCCAQCHEPLILPEWTEWLDVGRARHLWQCEVCGYAFETTVHFAAA